MAYQEMEWKPSTPLSTANLDQMTDNDVANYDNYVLQPHGFIMGGKRIVDCPLTNTAGMLSALGVDIPGVECTVTLTEPRRIRVGISYRSVRSTAELVFGMRLVEDSTTPVIECNVHISRANFGTFGRELSTILEKPAGTYHYKMNVVIQTGTSATGVLEAGPFAPILIYVQDMGEF